MYWHDNTTCCVGFCTQHCCGSENYFCAMCRKKSDLVIFTTVSHKIHLATPQYATLSSSLNNYLFIFCKMLTLRLTFAIFYWERIFQIPFFRNIMKKDECREITLRLTFASFWLERIKSLTLRAGSNPVKCHITGPIVLKFVVRPHVDCVWCIISVSTTPLLFQCYYLKDGGDRTWPS